MLPKDNSFQCFLVDKTFPPTGRNDRIICPEMPDMMGYDLAHLIHGRAVIRRLRITFVSGHRTDETDVRVGNEAGGVVYVCKPFDPVVLRSKVEIFAELHRQPTVETATLRNEITRPQQTIPT